MTDSFSGFSDLPGITISPPVTFATASTTTGQVVADCFTTNADSIFDAFTGETWVKDLLGSGFTQVGF